MHIFTKKMRLPWQTIALVGCIGVLMIPIIIAPPKAILPLTSRQPQEITVTLTDTGFQPDAINITTGTAVLFRTDRTVSFWPASDVHPTHQLYAEFDPKQPIGPGEEWRFQFQRVGVWQYHDHLAPYFTGIIRVSDPAGESLMQTKIPFSVSTLMAPLRAAMNKIFRRDDSIDGCNWQTNSEKIQCWQTKILHAARSGNTEKALDLVADLYLRDPAFAASCHPITHAIGAAAYEQLRTKKDVHISPKTSYCSFGFYHGFMEALMNHGDSMQSAREFCRKAQEQTGNASLRILTSCSHGVGHGATDTANPQFFGKEDLLLKIGLGRCEAFAQDLFQTQSCATGVFNSLGIAYANGENGFVLDRADPLKICHMQTDTYKESCYREMMMTILVVSEKNFQSALPIVVKHVEEPYAGIAVRTLAADSIWPIINKLSAKTYIPVCRTLPDKLALSCIEGLADGLMEFGAPAIEYKKTIELCKTGELTRSEQQVCFDALIQSARSMYSSNMVESICNSIPSSQRAATGCNNGA